MKQHQVSSCGDNTHSIKFGVQDNLISSCHVTKDLHLILSFNCDPLKIHFVNILLYNNFQQINFLWKWQQIGHIEIPCPNLKEMIWIPCSEDLLLLQYKSEICILKISNLTHSSSKIAYQQVYFYRSILNIRQLFWSENQNYLAILQSNESGDESIIQLIDFFNKKNFYQYNTKNKILSCKFEGHNLAILYDQGSIDGLFITPSNYAVQIKNLIYMKAKISQNICWSVDSRVFCSDFASNKLKIWSHSEKQVRDIRETESQGENSVVTKSSSTKKLLSFLNIETEHQNQQIKDYYLCVGNSSLESGKLQLLKLTVGKQPNKITKINHQLTSYPIEKVQSFPYIINNIQYILFFVQSLENGKTNYQLMHYQSLLIRVDDLISSSELDSIQYIKVLVDQNQILDYAPINLVQDSLLVESQKENSPKKGVSNKVILEKNQNSTSESVKQRTPPQQNSKLPPHSNQSSDKILKYMSINKSIESIENLKQNQKKQQLKFVNQIQFNNLFKRQNEKKPLNSKNKYKLVSQFEDISDAECPPIPYTGNDDIENVNQNSNKRLLREENSVIQSNQPVTIAEIEKNLQVPHLLDNKEISSNNNVAAVENDVPPFSHDNEIGINKATAAKESDPKENPQNANNAINDSKNQKIDGDISKNNNESNNNNQSIMNNGSAVNTAIQNPNDTQSFLVCRENIFSEAESGSIITEPKQQQPYVKNSASKIGGRVGQKMKYENLNIMNSENQQKNGQNSCQQNNNQSMPPQQQPFTQITPLQDITDSSSQNKQSENKNKQSPQYKPKEAQLESSSKKLSLTSSHNDFLNNENSNRIMPSANVKNDSILKIQQQPQQQQQQVQQQQQQQLGQQKDYQESNSPVIIEEEKCQSKETEKLHPTEKQQQNQVQMMDLENREIDTRIQESKSSDDPYNNKKNQEQQYSYSQINTQYIKKKNQKSSYAILRKTQLS